MPDKSHRLATVAISLLPIELRVNLIDNRAYIVLPLIIHYVVRKSHCDSNFQSSLVMRAIVHLIQSWNEGMTFLRYDSLSPAESRGGQVIKRLFKPSSTQLIMA
jgi:hypothetical protein